MVDVIQFVLLLFIAMTLWGNRKPAWPKLKKSGRKMILDTCALIDGRITELSQAGFVPDELVIPEFVLHELQLLADGADPRKRERARFGLDVVQELQDSRSCTVVIDRSSISEKQAIDDKLVALAKKLQAPLYTTDYNLNKVAEIEGVKVLNVNELAQHLRLEVLPGERKRIKIIQKGSSSKQGVGYLDDGTMLVVEDAANQVGKTVVVKITRVHQTVAGKMLFGETVGKPKKTLRPAASFALSKKSPAHAMAARMRRKI